MAPRDSPNPVVTSCFEFASPEESDDHVWNGKVANFPRAASSGASTTASAARKSSVPIRRSFSLRNAANTPVLTRRPSLLSCPAREPHRTPARLHFCMRRLAASVPWQGLNSARGRLRRSAVSRPTLFARPKATALLPGARLEAKLFALPEVEASGTTLVRAKRAGDSLAGGDSCPARDGVGCPAARDAAEDALRPPEAPALRVTVDAGSPGDDAPGVGRGAQDGGDLFALERDTDLDLARRVRDALAAAPAGGGGAHHEDGSKAGGGVAESIPEFRVSSSPTRAAETRVSIRRLSSVRLHGPRGRPRARTVAHSARGRRRSGGPSRPRRRGGGRASSPTACAPRSRSSGYPPPPRAPLPPPPWTATSRATGRGRGRRRGGACGVGRSRWWRGRLGVRGAFPSRRWRARSPGRSRACSGGPRPRPCAPRRAASAARWGPRRAPSSLWSPAATAAPFRARSTAHCSTQR